MTQWLNENIAILVALAKIQYTRDDEPTISGIQTKTKTDNEVYFVYIEFLNLFILCMH